MAYIKKSNVQDTATGAGTGALSLAGSAPFGMRAPAAVMTNGDTAIFKIGDRTSGLWEESLCTFVAGSPNTLTRTTVLDGSLGPGVLVNFGVGTKDASIVASPSKVVSEDPNGDATITRDLTVGRDVYAGNYKIGLETTNDAGTFGFSNGNGPGIIAWGNAAAGAGKLQFNAAGVEKLTLAANGDFGVNTSNPVAACHVNGDVLLESTGRKYYFARNGAAADSNWKFGLEAAPAGAHYATISAIVLDVFGGAPGYGFLIRGSGGGGLEFDGYYGNLTPTVDNVQSFGNASYRWATIYAGTGTINTSGRAAKVNISEATDAERRAAARIKALPRRYQLADAVAEKGEDVARWHFGYVAEDVRDALIAEGLDPWRYAFMCADKIMTTETYTEKAIRQKMEDYQDAERTVEIVGGRPVLRSVPVTRQRPVGTMVQVVDDGGKPVMVPGPNEDGHTTMVPMLHFVPEMEEYDQQLTRQVESGEMRLGLRYSELEVFLRCAE